MSDEQPAVREGARVSVPLPLDEHPVILAERLRRVMESIGGITKDGEYAQGSVHYNFRGIGQIAPRARDAMIGHGVVCVPVRAVQHITPREKGALSEARMTYRFLNCEDRTDFIDVGMIASAIDNGDKYVTKALTSAFKYLMLQSFCIGDPADDQDRSSGGAEEEEQEPLNEWPATEEEVETLRVAIALMSDASKAAFAEWWKKTGNMGSVKSGNVNGRYVPAALAVVQVLLDAETAESVTEPAH